MTGLPVIPRYRVRHADRLAIPATYSSEARYLGYRDRDWYRPFAHHFRVTAEPMQPDAREQLEAGRLTAAHGFEVSEAADIMSRAGYLPAETGWLRTSRGTLFVAVLTEMPGVTADMWDWWFGWHSTDPARYKLWHPQAHQFSAIADDRRQDRTLTDRQRYHDNVSFVDEFVGDSFSRLAIRFVDPGTVGFEDSPGSTVICAAVGLNAFPVVGGWLVHQVRPTDRGVEMRSRFFLGHAQILDVPRHSVRSSVASLALSNSVSRRALRPIVEHVTARQTTDRFARDLAEHCATEMNHLATFLPDLYDEFKDTP